MGKYNCVAECLYNQWGLNVKKETVPSIGCFEMIRTIKEKQDEARDESQIIAIYHRELINDKDIVKDT